MRLLQVYIAISALSWTSCKPSRDCDFGWEIYDCLKKIQFDVSGNMEHFMNEEELHNVCRKFMPAGECMVELAQWCTRNRKALMEIIFEQYKYMTELCRNDTTDFRREYLKHGQCINEDQSGYKFDCSEAIMAPPHPHPDYEDCQSFKNITEACDYNIQMTCGEDAAAVVTLLMQPVEAYYKKTCRTY